MAYSASIRIGQRTAKSNSYRTTSRGGLIWGTFMALFKLIGFSFILVLSLGFIVLISIALLYGYNAAMNSSFFALKEIEISGNRQLTYAKLTEIINVNPGDSILQLKMADLYSRLKSDPWIKAVSVKRIFPDRLVVNIEESQAYFWLQDQSKLFYADENGHKITPVSPDRYMSLPILYLEGEDQNHDLKPITSFLENRSFPFSLQDISWIRARDSGSVEMSIDSREISIILDRNLLISGPGRLNRVWADLQARAETDSVERIIIAGGNAWVGFRSQSQKQPVGLQAPGQIP